MAENGGGDLAHFDLPLLAGTALPWHAFAPFSAQPTLRLPNSP